MPQLSVVLRGSDGAATSSVAAGTARRRPGRGARLNPLGYSGCRSTRRGFGTYQRRLDELMPDDVQAPPVARTEDYDGVARTARAVLAALDAPTAAHTQEAMAT